MTYLNRKSIEDAIYYTLIDYPDVAFSVGQMFEMITGKDAVVDDCIRNKSVWTRSEYETFCNSFYQLPEEQKDVIKRYRFHKNRLEPVLLFATNKADAHVYGYYDREITSRLSDLSDYETLEALREIFTDRHKYTWFNMDQLVNGSETPLTFAIKMGSPSLFKAMLQQASYADLLVPNTYFMNAFDCVKKSASFELCDMLLDRVKQLHSQNVVRAESPIVHTDVIRTTVPQKSLNSCQSFLYFVAGTMTAVVSTAILFG